MLQTLKKKYKRNLSKRKIGEGPIFGLSKSVWGELGYLAGKMATVAKPQDHVFDVPKPVWRAPRYKNHIDGGEKKSSGGKETNETCVETVWSDEDKTALLQGLIDFKSNTGTHAYEDMSGFYEVVRKSVRVDVRKIEVIEKLRTLREKFESNLGQGKKGEEPTFVKPHDRKIFILSKSIWGALYYSGKSGEEPTFAKPHDSEVFDLSKPVWKAQRDENRDVKRRKTKKT
ncbi:unnamed protein product [Arabis nemorensis]|uniref:Glabrous enhancer-binding protein-like DBD domain-containing protein n=1 Tax=Arabis nemorensis TaxID=586526 RepID=A0A565AJR4_9BRAS|nr:unnamed protein product [Arabis nemorensis]